MDYDAEIQRVRRGGDKEDVERDWKKLHARGIYEELGEIASLLRKAERSKGSERAVDRARLTDELGDLCAYVALVAQDSGGSFERVRELIEPYQRNSTPETRLDELYYYAGLFAAHYSDVVRHRYARGGLLGRLAEVLAELLMLASDHGLTLEDLQRANVAKLRARFPGGYTIAAAEAKADERAGAR